MAHPGNDTSGIPEQLDDDPASSSSNDAFWKDLPPIVPDSQLHLESARFHLHHIVLQPQKMSSDNLVSDKSDVESLQGLPSTDPVSHITATDMESDSATMANFGAPAAIHQSPVPPTPRHPSRLMASVSMTTEESALSKATSKRKIDFCPMPDEVARVKHGCGGVNCNRNKDKEENRPKAPANKAEDFHHEVFDRVEDMGSFPVLGTNKETSQQKTGFSPMHQKVAGGSHGSGGGTEITKTEKRTRFRVATEKLDLNDGNMWRKYGQKSIKNHPFQRSYFKCIEAKSEGCCRVVKYVQRCKDDAKHVTFLYIGEHNHPPRLH